ATEARAADSLGRAAFGIERAAVRRGGKLTIRVRGQPLGSVDVVRTDMVAPATTGFVSGTGQRGIARTRLSEPLVFQVRSNLGRPLVGKVVAFRAVNADVETDSVATDSTGIARVDVTLGNQAGPALVTATVDSLERQAALSVEPGPPTGVILERDGTRVGAGATVSVTIVQARERLPRRGGVVERACHGVQPARDLSEAERLANNRAGIPFRPGAHVGRVGVPRHHGDATAESRPAVGHGEVEGESGHRGQADVQEDREGRLRAQQRAGHIRAAGSQVPGAEAPGS